MPAIDAVREAVQPLLEDLALDLYDVEHAQGTLRITVQGPAEQPVDSQQLTAATRAISSLLDALDPFPGRYTLEVSTPGLERTLRLRAHFAGAIGDEVSVRTVPGSEGDRRLRGVLLDATETGITVRDTNGNERTAAYNDIERARTVVDWSRPPKPGKARAGESASASDRSADRLHSRKATT